MLLETAKGMKDSLPEEEIVKQRIKLRLISIFELYGFSPMDTPAIEKWDILSSKYAGGEEILKESFKLSDQGKRRLGLRYDLTVPFARVVGMNPKMKKPFKRYQIGKVWRDGPVGTSRYREFWQCDVDVVGADSIGYESEMISLANRFFKEEGLKPIIRINNIKLLNDVMEYLDIKNRDRTILTIDKLSKIGRNEVKKELARNGNDEEKIEELLTILRPPVTNNEAVKRFKKLIPNSSGLSEISEVLDRCQGIEIKFDPSLARGLSYYTGTIIEIFLNSGNSAVCAGGRYDTLIGKINGRNDNPAVGISFGLSRIYDAVKESGRKTVTDLFVIPIATDCSKIAEKLRDLGVKTEIDLSEKGPSKNLKYANSKGVPFVAFIGKEEVKSGKIKIKEMRTGKESVIGIDEVPKIVNRKLFK